MDAQQLISEFLGSPQGAGAMGALAQAGVSPADHQQILSVAAAAGHEHVESVGGGLLGDEYGKSFFAAFAAGMVRGDGVLGAMGDGLEGVLVGRIAEALANRTGMDPAVAATVAAAVTPYVAGFIKQKLSGN